MPVDARIARREWHTRDARNAPGEAVLTYLAFDVGRELIEIVEVVMVQGGKWHGVDGHFFFFMF